MNQERETLLFIAAKNGYIEIVELLIEAGVGVNVANLAGISPLHIAAQYGRDKIVDRLLTAGARKNAISNSGQPPLFFAIMYNRLKICKKLLAAGVNVNVVDKSGWSALHISAVSKPKGEYTKQYRGQYIAQQLLWAGANKDKMQMFRGGHTPLLVALQYGNTKVAKVLIRGGASANIPSPNEKQFAMLFAKKTKDKKLIKMLKDSDDGVDSIANKNTLSCNRK
jgi:ankyrin repeat protein